jgi:N utilization substance protein B
MQAIYQWSMNKDAPVAEIEKQFAEDQEMQGASFEYFSQLIRGVVEHDEELSGLLNGCVSRPLDEIDPVERAVLLIAAYEFKHVPSVPYRAVINEAVELTKDYGAEAAYKFINGALDKLAGELRAVEKSA